MHVLPVNHGKRQLITECNRKYVQVVTGEWRAHTFKQIVAPLVKGN